MTTSRTPTNCASTRSPRLPSARSTRRAGWSSWSPTSRASQRASSPKLTSAAIEREITRQVEAAGGKIAAFYYCRHLATDNCACRKPQPGLILQAAREHGIDLEASVMVGDTERDIIAGQISRMQDNTGAHRQADPRRCRAPLQQARFHRRQSGRSSGLYSVAIIDDGDHWVTG